MGSNVEINGGDYVSLDDEDDVVVGQKQQILHDHQLRRSLTAIGNFSVTFSVVSVLTGLSTTYGRAMVYGGPLTMVWGWPIVSVFTMAVAVSMAEICSAYPAGGLYTWSAKLSGHRWGPLASWLTGWFNIVGQWACTTSVNFSLAQLIQAIIAVLSTSDKSLLSSSFQSSKYMTISLHGGLLLLHGVINSLPISTLTFFGQISAAWNLIGMLLLMVLVPCIAAKTASAEFVFTYFNTNDGEGVTSKVYIFLLGLVTSQYTLCGYDSAAYMTDETKDANKNGPKGIISAVGISIISGWGFILGITFAVSDISIVLGDSDDNQSGAYAIAQVLCHAFESRYGTSTGGIVCLAIIAMAVFFCAMSSITSNSRVAYTFSRDGAMPLSQLWHKVNNQDVPINAVWLSACVSFCMALPSLGSSVAFDAMVSIATMALYIAYGLPIFFRVTLARKHFKPGPFSLGRYGLLVGWIAVFWVVTITVLFSLPVAFPVTLKNLNYTPIAASALVVFVLSSWFLSAQHWFQGPATMK